MNKYSVEPEVQVTKDAGPCKLLVGEGVVKNV